MGWFDEQIRLRKQRDDEAFSDAFQSIAGAVLGEKLSGALREESVAAKDAIDGILKYYHIKSREIPDSIKDVNEQLEYLLRPYGIMRRTVALEGAWYKDAIGAMLGSLKADGRPVALLPAAPSGYCYLDPETGKRVQLNAKTQALFETEAIVFYKPFPLKKLDIPALLRYIFETFSLGDFVLLAVASLAVALVGMLMPWLNNLLFSEVITSGSNRLLLAMALCMVCVSAATMLISAVNNLLNARVSTKMSVAVEAAAMMRVLSLPADFFKKTSAGELAQRVSYLSLLCRMLVSGLFTTGLTSVFSLVYLTQVFHYAPALVVPALLVILVTLLFTCVSTLMQRSVTQRQMELTGEESGMTYALLAGVQKIKLAGAEKRAFARWAKLYAKQAALTYNPPLFLKLNPVIGTGITLAGTLVLYAAAIGAQVSVADYYAFNTAYGVVSGAFLSLSAMALGLAQLGPILEQVRPMMETVPEISEGKQVLTHITGGIEMNNVSFRYTDTMPLVVDDLTLKIRPGQYVAIVGKTGCGKSTLMRLLLGFETPLKGAVYFDGKDLSTIDTKSLRRRIGVVLQNGKLFQGDIYSNIVISAPWLTQQDAWDAAELAGVAEDIRHMPMGMNTQISEGAGGVSGGQRQRLMIARAIAPRPRILMFDEATSALDNLTQKKVAESLASLKCTRLVIAHRLSTIKNCDRILVLEQGHIIEDGTYQELIEKNGFFAELVARQRLDEADAQSKKRENKKKPPMGQE